MMFGMVIFWGALLLIAFAIRGAWSGGRGNGHRALGAREILEERFARGEISEDEFQGRTQALAPHRPSSCT